ncbi:hypothetical protein AXF42_Ash015341 [Apostasia shenzhenica]|uniref:Uncharacterized protein n=1 Tax=Apostasia shenzhenica TaxID=1088818 RepID=A0A2I0ALX5_9ASPA|nr:hypothetical protein AXF42_Ash015341 [Apostasia shenzhenica]
MWLDLASAGVSVVHPASVKVWGEWQAKKRKMEEEIDARSLIRLGRLEVDSRSTFSSDPQQKLWSSWGIFSGRSGGDLNRQVDLRSTRVSAGDDELRSIVIAADGSLCQYSGRFTAREVIASGARDTALCNSDHLFFHKCPPAVPPEELLEPGQIYFLLPVADLRRSMTIDDMAALAVRASMALRREEERKGRRIWRPRVAPEERYARFTELRRWKTRTAAAERRKKVINVLKRAVGAGGGGP